MVLRRLALIIYLLFTIGAYADDVALVDAQTAKPPSTETKPPQRPPPAKFEIGAALLTLHLPDYPGSDETRYRVLPVPFFVYRGDIFRADREGGYRGRFLKSEKFEFDVSGNGAFPTGSGDNDARTGMSKLDWMGELGPRFKYHIIKNPVIKLDFELPLRFVFSTDIEHWVRRGYTVTPELSFTHRALLPYRTFLNASVSGAWGTEPLMNYFYEVDTNQTLASRPAYNAHGGFLSVDSSVSIGRPFANEWFFFMGVSRSFYAGAENRRSPLLKDIETESYFMGIAKNIYKSEELAIGAD